MTKSRRGKRSQVVSKQQAGNSQHEGSVTVTHQEFSGPIPHSSELQNYEAVTKGLAERIVRMAEQEQAHRIECEKKGLSSDVERRAADTKEIKTGQWFAFIIVMTGIISGVILVLKGSPVVGTIFGGASILALASLFIFGRSKKQGK